MESSDRIKTYFTALYLKLYTLWGAMFLPLMIMSYMSDSTITMADLGPIVYYLAIFISSAFDDPANVSQELKKKVAANRTPHVKRRETIQYSILFIVYCLPLILHRYILHPSSPWLALLGPILIVIVYLLRPGNLRLNIKA